MDPCTRFVRLWLALVASAGLACSTPSPAPPPAAPAPPPVSAPPPSQAELPKPPEPGTRPSLPLSRGSEVKLPDVEVVVKDVARGAAAERLLKGAEAGQTEDGAAGELLAVRLELRGAGSGSSWVSCKDVRVTGSSLTLHFHAPLPFDGALEPRAVAPGESAEGWCAYTVASGERDLLLVVNDPADHGPDGLRYLALEDGATLADPPSAKQAAHDPVGASAERPAPLQHAVVTRDWSVTALELLRGDAAAQLVTQANASNGAPADGMEYVAVKLRGQYLGRDGTLGLFSASQFEAVSQDGKEYAAPIVIDVAPRLNRTLLPGGEHTGWAVFQVKRDEAHPLLRFQPYYPDNAERFIALGAAG